MKYVEELKAGDLIIFENKKFILTSDYRSDKNKTIKRLAVNIENGFLHWLRNEDIVNILDLYIRDKEGNILALKEIKNEYSEKNSNIL